MSLITAIRNSIDHFLRPEIPDYHPNAMFPLRPRSYGKQLFEVLTHSLAVLAGAALGYAVIRNFTSPFNSRLATTFGGAMGFTLTYRTLSGWKKQLQQRHNQFQSIVRTAILASHQAVATPAALALVPALVPVLAPALDDRARGG